MNEWISWCRSLSRIAYVVPWKCDVYDYGYDYRLFFCVANTVSYPTGGILQQFLSLDYSAVQCGRHYRSLCYPSLFFHYRWTHSYFIATRKYFAQPLHDALARLSACHTKGPNKPTFTAFNGPFTIRKIDDNMFGSVVGHPPVNRSTTGLDLPVWTETWFISDYRNVDTLECPTHTCGVDSFIYTCIKVPALTSNHS